jgi:hypothetical protein
MIYVKCTLAGLLAVLAAFVLLVIAVVVVLTIASRSLQSSQGGSVGWDPISLARPFTWLAAVVGILLLAARGVSRVGECEQHFQLNIL